MNKAEMLKKVARLEFIHDQLSTELTYVDHLLKVVGFPNGLESAKSIAEELVRENIHLKNLSERDE